MRRLHLALSLLFVLSGFARAENYAFLVGVGGYDEKQLRGLGEYPRSDVIALRDVLLESGFEKENVVLMVDDWKVIAESKPIGRFLPLASNVRRELDLLLPALDRDDTLIIAFSGHGVQFKGDAEPYFCPADADLTDKSTLLSLSWLYDRLTYDAATGEGCKPRRKLLLVDACRNDPGSRLLKSTGGPELESVSRPQLAKLPEGIVALFSCAEGQQALQHDPLKHGVFFYHVLEGLRGKADGDGNDTVTLDEVIAYAKSKTATYARAKLTAEQTPRQRGFFDGEWTLRKLARLPAPVRPPALASSFTAQQAEASRAAWAKFLGRKAEHENSLGMKFVLVPPGTFRMGSSDTVAATNERPHTVSISKPFYVAKHETTVAQFRAFAEEQRYRTTLEQDDDGSNRGWSTGQGRFVYQRGFSWRNPGWTQEPDHPVVNISWLDAQAFLKWLSRKEDGVRYRLLTEAEWEYCCRAGTTTSYSIGSSPDRLTLVGNVLDDTGMRLFGRDAQFRQEYSTDAVRGSDRYEFTAPVGKFETNNLGLCDFHGNVCEWCEDWYADDYGGTDRATDPQGASFGKDRAARGGRFDTGKYLAKSHTRNHGPPRMSDMILGFRVAMEIK